MESLSGADTAWVLISAALVMLMTPRSACSTAGWSGRRMR